MTAKKKEQNCAKLSHITIDKVGAVQHIHDLLKLIIKIHNNTHLRQKAKNIQIRLKRTTPRYTEDIKISLAEQAHLMVNIYNIKHRTTKKPLPMFHVDITPKENNKQVYKLGNGIIKCERPNTKRIILQCTRCQAYGHTETDCRKSLRCVKREGQRETKCIAKRAMKKLNASTVRSITQPDYRGYLVHKQRQQKL